MNLAWLVLILGLGAQTAEAQLAPEYAAPDDRYKADILLIVAHPDDETGDVAGYLARAVLDEHRRAAAIFTTRGDGGRNAGGNELGLALGAEREIEARQGLALLGVTNVWFLNNAYDTPSQNVLRSLAHMDHGSALAQVVRLVRLTRPEVILTWLPMPVAGENHADHQAASVLANEAFDLAGDPSVFGEELGTTGSSESAAGRDPDGLRPWQPKKIYYFSDATDVPFHGTRPEPPSPFRRNFANGAGPQYLSTDESPSRKVSYGRLIAEEQSVYLTQEGDVGTEALQKGDLTLFEYPSRFIFGKSLVGGSATGDIFEGVERGPVPFAHPQALPPQSHRGISLEPGGPWAFYRAFWTAHGLERVADLLPIPEFTNRAGRITGAGRSIDIPLIIRNDDLTERTIILRAVLPDGWVDGGRFSSFPLPADSVYPAHRTLTIPATAKPGWYEVAWNAEAAGSQVGSVTWRVYVFR